jgi:hypothetical protein
MMAPPTSLAPARAVARSLTVKSAPLKSRSLSVRAASISSTGGTRFWTVNWVLSIPRMSVPYVEAYADPRSAPLASATSKP